MITAQQILNNRLHHFAMMLVQIISIDKLSLGMLNYISPQQQRLPRSQTEVILKDTPNLQQIDVLLGPFIAPVLKQSSYPFDVTGLGDENVPSKLNQFLDFVGLHPPILHRLLTVLLQLAVGNTHTN
jgi:hypothetical protein